MATDRERIEQANTQSAVREAAVAAAGVPKNPLAAREGAPPRPAVTATPKTAPVHPAVAAAQATVAPAAPHAAQMAVPNQTSVTTGQQTIAAPQISIPAGAKNLAQVYAEFKADILARIEKYGKDIGA